MNARPESIVIVGAGQAGLQAAASLRDEGYDGAIRLIGDEAGLPYQRPPLSKSFITGDVTADDLSLEEPHWFDDARIERLAGERVAAIDRRRRRLSLSSGRVVPYDHLVLAAGSRNRALTFAAQPAHGIVSLRSLSDAHRLKTQLEDARRVVVIGGGFLGLEVASVAAAKGRDVHVVESVDRVMKRAISAEMSAAYAAHHEAAGVRFSFDARVERIVGRDDRVCAVELADGTRLDADLVLVAAGVVPNSELAVACGLSVYNGIIVDARLRTSDAAISAIGDCAAFPYAFDGGDLLRLESVQNAVDQARHVARALLGDSTPYDQTPVFWSDQGGARLQIAGVARRLDSSVVRGDPASGAFSVFRYRHHRLTGVESCNRPAEHMAARRLLQRRISPTREQAADPSFDLKLLLTLDETV
ncbi:FAD-dependent pyridine nucleotide-disulfide oxidoreductase [Caballeronia arvi]|uniref:FAD-dependent pyridine nucleotide-disulfide oxidoreductase n=1 Tax=Caballeronia arvi TaxID=1777135 RepID=A0A158JA02_9BURK|nr:FAD-dependent oxidoreductase [Caballeronia arvi]SAL65666.1 FAD-dependent pyridine nucleotide-disulfide oxidoreductase [Caballeronia arvi]